VASKAEADLADGISAPMQMRKRRQPRIIIGLSVDWLIS